MVQFEYYSIELLLNYKVAKQMLRKFITFTSQNRR